MLRGNLATRPFYSQRAATLAIAVVAALVAVLTAFNATQIARLSADRRRVHDQIARDRAEAARIRQRIGSSPQSVDRPALMRLATATRQANDLIGQRTFSWTAFFAVIERTLPIDVRLIDVSPRVEQGTVRVTMTVVGRALADIGAFINALRSSGVFPTVAAIDQQMRDDGTYGATLEAEYTPGVTEPAQKSEGGR